MCNYVTTYLSSYSTRCVTMLRLTCPATPDSADSIVGSSTYSKSSLSNVRSPLSNFILSFPLLCLSEVLVTHTASSGFVLQHKSSITAQTAYKLVYQAHLKPRHNTKCEANITRSTAMWHALNFPMPKQSRDSLSKFPAQCTNKTDNEEQVATEQTVLQCHSSSFSTSSICIKVWVALHSNSLTLSLSRFPILCG